MKIPKTTKRFCQYCKKKTDQKIKLVSTGAKRGTLTRGSISRAKQRGLYLVEAFYKPYSLQFDLPFSERLEGELYQGGK